MNKLKLLQDWQATMQESDALLEALDKVLGHCDGALRQNVWTMQGQYTVAIGLALGETEYAGIPTWPEWYAFENDFGRKGLTASVGKGQPLRKIRTLKQLLALIEASNK